MPGAVVDMLAYPNMTADVYVQPGKPFTQGVEFLKNLEKTEVPLLILRGRKTST